ncbi:MAG: C-terminal binding protein [Streptosporangiaceae bacterium]|jgi:D-3-phosphoglycerate dehydrogenase
MTTVVIAYGQRAQTELETGLLEGMGYQVRYLNGLSDRSGLDGADALMVTVQEVTDEILAAMPACKIVARVGTGLDSIDLDAAARRGIQVTYVADYSVDEVSTHAIALLLSWARRIPQYLDLVRAGQWNSVGAGTIRRLTEQALGVAGFGRIGQAAAGKARGLGLRVLVCDPYRSGDDIRAAGCEPASWGTLLAESDFISLHVPLTPDSEHLIDAAALRAMKPTAVLINTARGALVDEAALAAAISAGEIAGAALDVLATEPPAADSPLLADPRVLITPHGAWYSTEAQRDVAVRACEDVQRVLSGQPPRSPANSPA